MSRVAMLLSLVAALALRCTCTHDAASRPLRIATFNIEDFPKDERQIAGAFDEIAALDAQIVALQEIMDPGRFEQGMRARLGPYASVVFEPFVERGYRHSGVLYDRRAFAFVSMTTHDETKLGRRHKSVLEVRLRPLAGGAIVRVLVVHLKSGSDGRPVRAAQHRALARIVSAATRSGERVVVLGDFNATHDIDDRGDLARLARSTGLVWNTQSLACSAFWKRSDGCPRSRLDHVITWSAGTARAAGACATHGCDWQSSCPIYRDHVSDHCPVIVELP